MTTPKPLIAGDAIGLAAPGRKVKPADVEHAIKVFESWGLKVVLAKNIFSNDHAYLAGTDAQRLYDFQSLLDDDSVKAIICARGGYGSTRILDHLDFNSFLKSQKWIAGFSDITAFHLKLLKLEVASIHSTMPILFSRSESRESIESLRSVFFGEPQSFLVKPNVLNRNGNGTGRLVGGNLSLLVDSIGTNSEVDTTDSILVIEEVDEYLYKIDRMMVQLKRSGKFNSLRGLVVGHMTDIKDTELTFGETVEEIILNHTSTFKFPVAFNFPIGHENPNLAWINGSTARLEVSADTVGLHVSKSNF